LFLFFQLDKGENEDGVYQARSVNLRMSLWCLIFSKKTTKNLTNCPESKKWSNHEIKPHYIDLNSNYVQIILLIMRRCFYFVVLITFDILGQKFVKFSVGFLENFRLSKRHSEINWPLVEVPTLFSMLGWVWYQLDLLLHLSAWETKVFERWS
jgi:hypothetical protein